MEKITGLLRWVLQAWTKKKCHKKSWKVDDAKRPNAIKSTLRQDLKFFQFRQKKNSPVYFFLGLFLTEFLHPLVSQKIDSQKGWSCLWWHPHWKRYSFISLGETNVRSKTFIYYARPKKGQRRPLEKLLTLLLQSLGVETKGDPLYLFVSSL